MSDETPQAEAFVNNGARPLLDLEDFTGPAGFVQRGAAAAQLAYIPNKRGGRTDVGKVIAIGGAQWSVIARENSPLVERMILLTLAKVEG